MAKKKYQPIQLTAEWDYDHWILRENEAILFVIGSKLLTRILGKRPARTKTYLLELQKAEK